MKDINKVKQGKLNRAHGSDFERRTRIDLESKGWFASKFQSNVNLEKDKLVPAKASKFRLATTGFPDYIAFKRYYYKELDVYRYRLIGVECKVNGYLSQEEKAKCIFLIENFIFSEILIASKTKEKGKIKINYKKFNVKNEKQKTNHSKDET